MIDVVVNDGDLCDGGSDSIKPNLLDSGPDLHAIQQAPEDTFLDVGQISPVNVDMHAIKQVCDDVICTTVQEQALRDETPVVGQKGPSDGDVHAVERVSCHFMESPDVMNYHYGLKEP